MLKCYLIKEISIWGNSVPLMVCASKDEAKVLVKILGVNEIGIPRGSVIELPYQPSRGVHQ